MKQQDYDDDVVDAAGVVVVVHFAVVAVVDVDVDQDAADDQS